MASRSCSRGVVGATAILVEEHIGRVDTILYIPLDRIMSGHEESSHKCSHRGTCTNLSWSSGISHRVSIGKKMISTRDFRHLTSRSVTVRARLSRRQ